METACVQAITILYIYLCVSRLDFRLNNINYHQSLSFIICIDLNHHCHYYWTSESLLNLWEYIQGSDITNKWVVHFVIDSMKVARVCNWLVPITCTDLQVFLGFTNFYQRFIYGFLDIVHPLFDITKSTSTWT